MYGSWSIDKVLSVDHIRGFASYLGSMETDEDYRKSTANYNLKYAFRKALRDKDIQENELVLSAIRNLTGMDEYEFDFENSNVVYSELTDKLVVDMDFSEGYINKVNGQQYNVIGSPEIVKFQGEDVFHVHGTGNYIEGLESLPENMRMTMSIYWNSLSDTGYNQPFFEFCAAPNKTLVQLQNIHRSLEARQGDSPNFVLNSRICFWETGKYYDLDFTVKNGGEAKVIVNSETFLMANYWDSVENGMIRIGSTFPPNWSLDKDAYIKNVKIFDQDQKFENVNSVSFDEVFVEILSLDNDQTKDFMNLLAYDYVVASDLDFESGMEVIQKTPDQITCNIDKDFLNFYDLADSRKSYMFDTKEFNAIVGTIVEHRMKRQCEYLNIKKNILDIDRSSGKSLDIIGKLVGQPRNLVNFIVDPYFGFKGARKAQSFNVGYWYSLNAASRGALRVLTDVEYRKVIKARIIKNSSRNTRKDLIEVFKLLGDGVPTLSYKTHGVIEVIVNENSDSTGLISYFLSKYLETDSIIPRPLGYRLILKNVENAIP